MPKMIAEMLAWLEWDNGVVRDGGICLMPLKEVLLNGDVEIRYYSQRALKQYLVPQRCDEFRFHKVKYPPAFFRWTIDSSMGLVRERRVMAFDGV